MASRSSCTDDCAHHLVVVVVEQVADLVLPAHPRHRLRLCALSPSKGPESTTFFARPTKEGRRSDNGAQWAP